MPKPDDISRNWKGFWIRCLFIFLPVTAVLLAGLYAVMPARMFAGTGGELDTIIIRFFGHYGLLVIMFVGLNYLPYRRAVHVYGREVIEDFVGQPSWEELFGFRIARKIREFESQR